MAFFAIHLVGGGSDIACSDCLSEARHERQRDGIRSVGRTDLSAGECCGWCGAEASDPSNRVTR